MTPVRSSASFDWTLDPRICFGPGRLSELGQLVAEFGDRALLVVDAGVAAQAGPSEVAKASLALARVEVHTFEQVLPNPDLELVRAVGSAAARHGCDVLVGLGGGATMDVTKCAAAYALQPELFVPARWPDRDPVLWQDPQRYVRLPLVQVPTTAATGAEISAVASLQAGSRRRLLSHQVLAADLALIDPDLTVTVPPRQTAAGGVEMFCRVLCYYLADQGLLVQDLLAEGLMRANLTALDAAAARPDDLEARCALSLVCAVSMTHLVNLGRDPWGQVLWYLQDSVRHVAELDKGTVMAALLPSYLSAIAHAQNLGPGCGTPQRLGRLAGALFDLAPGPEPAQRVVAEVTARLRRHQLPASLGELGLGVAEAAAAADYFAGTWGREEPLARFPREQVEASLTAALTGAAL